ncbi:MAG: enoyl-CoA hydratase-related protein, partial [Acidobacteriota bacterium]|nr:enoyl-CoA hydratase-related protein [Acidobacteriota bacterium]
LNRPAVLNALNASMVRELDHAFAALAGLPSVRAIVLTGAGSKAFAAGADIAELAAADAAEGEQIARRAQRVFRRIETLGKPVLAAINGFALGGGLELALACTLRLAAEHARLGQPEINLGVIPGFGGTQRLPRLIGQSAALRIILTGERIAAPEALRLGLIDELVPTPGAETPSADPTPAGPHATPLLARALQLAHTLAAMPPLAVAAAIEAVTRGADLPLEDALALEAEIFGRLCATPDKAEGTQAFLERRTPRWSGP